MAKKKAPEKKLERVYNVPLRSEWLKSPKYRRAKKAVTGLKSFIAKHMKVDLPNVKVGPKLNQKLWERGIKNPPHHVKVTAIKEALEDKETVKVELEGVEFKTITPKSKVEKAPGLRGKLEKALGARKEEKAEKAKKGEAREEQSSSVSQESSIPVKKTEKLEELANKDEEKKEKQEDLTDKEEEKKLEKKKGQDKVLTEAPNPAQKEAPKPHLEPKHESEQIKKLERSKTA
ncbi:MAG: 50S ribosomal protein L31e [Nanoarchaeota archaeon]|nr:50S ribosomal protein L31e [Nanoarchaeota archaeon]